MSRRHARLGGGALLIAIFAAGLTLAPSDSRPQPPASPSGIASHAATLVADGRVLVAGGRDAAGWSDDVDIFAPGVDPVGLSLGVARGTHTGTLLPDGGVLIAGGTSGTGALDTLEVIEPATGVAMLASRLPHAVREHAAALTPRGQVAITGGRNAAGAAVATVQAVDVANDHAVELLPLTAARAGHSATLLTDGRVLIAGGATTAVLDTAEMLDPMVLTSAPVADRLGTARTGHTATLLPSGDVLLVGGVGADSRALASVEQFDGSSGTFRRHAATLAAARAYHAAVLLPSGGVLVWGGVDANGALLANGEVLRPDTGATRMVRDLRAALAADTTAPSVMEARPRHNARGVSVLPQLAVRFSEPLAVTSITPTTVTMSGPGGGTVPVLIVPAETGLLLFVTPTARLREATTYALQLVGLTDTAGHPLPETTIVFTTVAVAGGDAGGGGGAGGARPHDGDRVIPEGDEDVRIARDPRTGKPVSKWQDLPPLMAPPGVTAVSGQVLRLNGEPLANVTLRVEGVSAKSDDTGRFLIQRVDPGPGKLTMDGRTANRADATYGIFDVAVVIPPKQTLVLPYTIWMPQLDLRAVVRFASPTRGDVTLTHPALPGFEIHLAPGTVVEDRDGRVITELGITPIPPDRPPFPLPEEFAMYFTVQPGGAHLSKGAKVTYSNEHSRGQPGKTWHFWNHEPEGGIGWYRYGRGTVHQDGKRIHADEPARLYKITMSGCCPGEDDQQPTTSDTLGGTADADPVSLSSGLFVLKKTDLVVSDTLPIALERTYRQEDPTVREFGLGSRHPYDMVFARVGSPITQWQEANVILPSGTRIHYVVIQSGTWPQQWVYEHRDTPTAFFKSRMVYNQAKVAWEVVLKDGTTYSLDDHSGRLMEIRDRYGNTVTMTRRNLTTGQLNNAGAITRLTSPNGRFIELTYDAAARIAEATDNIGRSVKYEYDASSRLVKVTDPGGGVKEYTYDGSGRMLTAKDARGITIVTNEYYTTGADTGRVKKQTLADGTSTYQFAYTNDGQGRITQTDVTDPRGYVRRVTFNAAGYELTDTRALGQTEQQTTTYERDSDPLRGGLVRAITDALGRRTEYDYNTPGNVTTIRRLAGTADQITSTLTYEPCVHDTPSGYCRVTSITPSTATTDGVVTLSYTGLTQTAITDALSHTTTITYDATGQPTQVLTPLGTPPIAYAYTGGLLASMTDRLGRTTTWTYDAAGRRASRTDPFGRTTSWAYSAMNRLLAVGDSAGGTTRFNYDGSGNLLSVMDARGNATTYTYDAMGRRATRTDPLAKSETFQYDGRGNPTSYTDRKTQGTTFTYDALNRRTGTTGSGYTIANTWDAGHRLTQIVDSVGGTISRAYDVFDRLTTETTALGTVRYDNPGTPSDRGYDTLGRRLWMEVPGQTRVTYAWDAASRLTQIQQGTQTVGFTYDTANRRTLLALPNGVSTEYQYDGGSRLTALIYRNGAGELGRLTYDYDPATSRAAVGGSFAATLLPEAVASASYNTGNRQTAFGTKTLTYDDNGNLTQITEGSDVTTFGWDSRDRLTSFVSPQPLTATFAYDASGRRASKTIGGVTTQFQYDGVDLARELVSGNPTGYLVGPGIDEVLVRGGAEFFLSDALGSTVALTDATAAVASSYQYEAFGRAAESGTPSTNAVQFTGRENDGTSLQYFRARYHMPGLHRFVSEDPTGFSGGDANLYAYVFNSPTAYRDPHGLTANVDGAGGPSGPPPMDCLDSSPPGTPGCGGGQGSGKTQLACGPACAGIALQMLRAAIIAAGGAAIAQQIIDSLLPLDLSRSRASDTDSDRDGSNDKLVPDSVIKKMKEDPETHPHVLKPSSKQDLFYDPSTGKIYVKPKNNKGSGEDTGLNVNDFK